MENTEGTLAENYRLGGRVRQLRQKRSYTLQDLAAKTGLAKSLLEQLESDQYNPPVATLFKIAKALEVNVAHFFQEQEEDLKVALTRVAERMHSVKRSHQQDGEVGYSYASLEVHKGHKLMQPLLVTFDVMEKRDMVFVSHDGQECVYLIEGELEFRTPDQMYTLAPGDCLYFESDIPHAFRSLGPAPAQALVVVSSAKAE